MVWQLLEMWCPCMWSPAFNELSYFVYVLRHQYFIVSSNTANTLTQQRWILHITMVPLDSL